MSKRAGGIPMRDRVARNSPPPETCPGRHCWVFAGPGDVEVGQRRPGLLVEWRQADGGWEARVVYLSCPNPGRWVLAEEWLPAAVLLQA